MHEYRDRDSSPEPATASEHDPAGPLWTTASLLRLQRLAGNSAVTLAIQRDQPTRAENIAALKSEIAEATADPTKWKQVAFRLNAFVQNDLPNVCVEIPAAQLQAARSAVEQHLPGWPNQAAILAAIDTRARTKNVTVRPLSSSIWAAYTTVSYTSVSRDMVWERIGGSFSRVKWRSSRLRVTPA